MSMGTAMKDEFFEGKRGFTVFLTGTLMCLGVSGYSIAKGNPVGDVVSVLYWWSTIAGMWLTKIAVEKVKVKKS